MAYIYFGLKLYEVSYTPHFLSTYFFHRHLKMLHFVFAHHKVKKWKIFFFPIYICTADYKKNSLISDYYRIHFKTQMYFDLSLGFPCTVCAPSPWNRGQFPKSVTVSFMLSVQEHCNVFLSSYSLYYIVLFNLWSLA